MYPYATAKMIPDFAFALSQGAASAVDEYTPHLRGDFPSFGQFDFEIGSDATISVVVVKFKSSGIPSGGEMDDDKFSRLKSLIGHTRGYYALKGISALSSYFDWDRFLIALDVVNGEVDWHLAQAQLGEWLGDMPLERANRHNVTRVLSAIPQPPQYSLARVQSAMWVLECDETLVQGTAFDLDPYGAVTNCHVVHGATAMVAFRANTPEIKYPIRVLKQNSVIDLAIIDIVDGPRPSPLSVDPSETNHMAHLAVCGFPNFRVGDSGVLNPGLIIGKRTVSGIQRLMTNAPIVAGMSGGPVLGASDAVIGICVTGAELFREARNTEDHAIIPVTALDILT